MVGTAPQNAFFETESFGRKAGSAKPLQNRARNAKRRETNLSAILVNEVVGQFRGRMKSSPGRTRTRRRKCLINNDLRRCSKAAGAESGAVAASVTYELPAGLALLRDAGPSSANRLAARSWPWWRLTPHDTLSEFHITST